MEVTDMLTRTLPDAQALLGDRWHQEVVHG